MRLERRVQIISSNYITGDIYLNSLHSSQGTLGVGDSVSSFFLSKAQIRTYEDVVLLSDSWLRFPGLSGSCESRRSIFAKSAGKALFKRRRDAGSSERAARRRLRTGRFHDTQWHCSAAYSF
jgi:hypothetical protein